MQRGHDVITYLLLIAGSTPNGAIRSQNSTGLDSLQQSDWSILIMPRCAHAQAKYTVVCLCVCLCRLIQLLKDQ